MNNYNQLTYISVPSPLQFVYDVMATNASRSTPRVLDEYEDLAESTGLDTDEVDLFEISLPVFKFKSALTFALDLLGVNFPNHIESDSCTLYLAVLEGIKK